MKREKDPSSLQFNRCFTSEQLFLYKTGNISDNNRKKIFHHLNVEKCARCRLIIQLLEPDQFPSEKTIKRAEKTHPSCLRTHLRKGVSIPKQIETGQIWTVNIPEYEGILPPVLITHPGKGKKTKDNIIRIMPLSFDIEFHLLGETVQIDRKNPLGYPILVEIFNERPMMAEHLNEYRGKISKKHMKEINNARIKFIEGNIGPEDEEFKGWKSQELRLCETLSYPANRLLLKDEIPGETIEFPIVEYLKAADTSELHISDLNAQTLLYKKGIIFGLVQDRDRIVLRWIIDFRKMKPPKTQLNDKLIEFIKKTHDIYEAEIGYIDNLPQEIEIKTEFEDKIYSYKILFKKNDSKDE